MSARLTSLMNHSTTDTEVKYESLASYSVSYQASVRGRHELSVEVNGQPIAGSPFRVYNQQPPRLLGRPVRVIKEIKYPKRASVGDNGHLLLASRGKVTMLNGDGAIVNTFDPSFSGVKLNPCCVAVHGSGDIFMTEFNAHKVFKLSSSGRVLKFVGGEGSGIGEFDHPDGLSLRDKELFVCDRDNHRIQVFDLDLNFIRMFGSRGEGNGQFHHPADLTFDPYGTIYIVDSGNNRIQVFTPNESFERTFGVFGKEPGEMYWPRSIHVDYNTVYITESKNDRVSMFTRLGEFVTSFGGHGRGEGEFSNPIGLTMDHDGYLYVCDWSNDRVQVF